jgi:NAD(P)-dependent dehydrogenase (short-subunit alcohol dehydrogenase family)
MDLQLTGKRAIVTGGSRGIGKAIARQLAEEGVDVVIAARGRDRLEAAAAEIAKATGRRILPIVADMGDDASVEALVAMAAGQLGGIDILVNNAAAPGGTVPSAKIEQVTGANLLFDVNVKVAGYLRSARAVAPHLVKNGWGRIINIGGGAAHRQLHRVSAQRRRFLADQESGGRTRPQGRQCRRHPPRLDARRANDRSGRGGKARRIGKHRPYRRCKRDRFRGRLSCLAQERRHQRGDDCGGRWHAWTDPLLSAR